MDMILEEITFPIADVGMYLEEFKYRGLTFGGGRLPGIA
jgi:hypothetical protein